ncbi:MAG TPA: hypothetical protein VIF62_11110, partial [Labilithrix sp.]
MTTHLDSFVRVTVVLGLALVSMPLLRRHSATVRRLVLSAAFASALAAPFMPVWRSSGPAYHALVGKLVAEPGASAGAATASASAVAHSVDWFVVAWAASALVVALRFLVGHVGALRIARRARPAADGDSDVRVSSEVDAPAVIGIVSPIVVVPTSS